MIRWLETLTRADAPLFGGKAAQLGELASRGFPVPPGFVVGPEALEAFVASVPNFAGFLAQADRWEPAEVERITREQFMGHPLPPAVEAALVEAYGALGQRAGREHPAVAVRSSARGEDAEAASFAGQQVTFLNAEGPAVVGACLRGCWAGLFAERATSYRRRLQAEDGQPPAMAVLVQLLVWPDVAGVAFTVNPLTGDRDELILDASWGLGEAVVSGRATPDHVRLDKATGAVRHYSIGAKQVRLVPDEAGVAEAPVPPEQRARKALDERMLHGLSSLARQVEAYYGAPQDLEWAFQGGQMYLLQARPITALPPPPPPGGWRSPEPGVTWERRNFAEHFPGPASLLAQTLLFPAVERALVRLAKDAGWTLKTPALTALHGFAYARGSMTRRWDFPLRAGWFYARLLLFPPKVERVAALQPRRLAGLLQQQPADAPAIVAWCEAYAAALAAGWGEVHRLSAGWRWSEYALLSLLQTNHLGATLMGFDSPALALERRARDAARLATPDVTRSLFEPGAPAPPEAEGQAFADAVSALREAGLALPSSFDPADALPFEHPGQAVHMVTARLVGTSPDPDARLAEMQRARTADAAALPGQVTGWRRLAVQRAVPWAQAFAAVREPALAGLGVGWHAFRQHLLALGELFVAAGKLSAARQVFDLRWDEVKAMAAGGAGPAATELRLRADGRRAAAELAPPHLIGGEPVPVRARAGAIAGTPASPGRVSGTARIVRGPADFASLMPGDILVAPATTPAWTPLFARAAAVVTDVGGPLSHGSIVAREYRIPAVLGTENATMRLQEGERITVDGDLGLVWRGG